MSSSSASGFSLIELIVATVILVTLSGGGILALNSINEDQKLKKAVRQVFTGMYETRQMALYGKKPNDTCTGFDYTKFVPNTCTSDGCSFKILALCGGTEITVKTVQMDKGIVITPNSAFTVNTISGTISNTITYSIQLGTKIKQIEVSNTGGIKEL